MKKVFIGFGFGAIQAGLFVYEAFRSGNFKTIVVSEIMPDTVNALKQSGGCYTVNIAGKHGIERRTVENIIILNPGDRNDRAKLVEFIAQADEMATALPSIDFFRTGESASVARLIAEGLSSRAASRNKQAVIYAAENNNHAAEALRDAVSEQIDDQTMLKNIQFLNTVIGKMSGIVADQRQIAEQELKPVTNGLARCFLVEEFNRILVDHVTLPGFQRGIDVFIEKEDLLPFEYAKLYGHNATHALIGYLAAAKSLAFMDQVKDDPHLLNFARDAFLNESGAALIRKFKGKDELFTEPGWNAYAEDLLERMMNPHLRDAVERVTRDPLRKLSWDDRLIGVMRLAISQGIEPVKFAAGAAAAFKALQSLNNSDWPVLESEWKKSGAGEKEISEIRSLISENLNPDI